MRVEGLGASVTWLWEGGAILFFRQHELNDQGPMLRPSAVDVLQACSVFVFVSYMTQASYQRPTCHGVRFSQGISLILQSCREEQGAERPLGSSEEIFATLAALAHGVGFHCHSLLTPLFPPRYLSAALHADLLFPDLACRLFVLLHHPLHTRTLSSSFSGKILETSVWKEQQIADTCVFSSQLHSKRVMPGRVGGLTAGGGSREQ